MPKPTLFEARVGAMSAAGFIINGFYLPFFPVWLDLVGMGAAQISVILSMAMIARIVTAPFIMAFTDRSAERVHVLVVLSLLSVACAALFIVTRSFAALVAVSFVLGVVSGCQMPITDSVALSGVRRFGSDYARMRIWGSISFLVANLAGGLLLQRLGAGIMPGLLLASFAVTALVAFFMPRLGPPREKAPLPGAVVQTAGRAFLKPAFVLFMAAASLVQAGHALAYGFSSIYWRSIGIGETTIGLLWAIGVLAEILLFYRFKRSFSAVRPVTMLLIGAAMAVLRWTAFPLVEPAGFGVVGFLAVQAMHAFSFGLTYLAMQQKTAEAIDEHELGAAQGAYVFLSGLTLAAGLYFSGPLYAAFNVHGFWAMAAVAAAGLALAIATLRAEARETR
ncbi:MAG: MFS transporter [Rhizobiaceae bacterium]